MVLPLVTVENAVDTGVGTHADILALGHLPSPRILKPINSRGSRRRMVGRRMGGGAEGIVTSRGGVSVSWRGIKYGGRDHWMVEGKEKEEG